MQSRQDCLSYIQNIYTYYCETLLRECMAIEAKSSPKPGIASLFKRFDNGSVAEKFTDLCALASATMLAMENYREPCTNYGLGKAFDILDDAYCMLINYLGARADQSRALDDKSRGVSIHFDEFIRRAKHADMLRKELVDSLNTLNETIAACL